jgi:PAS domain S-box-containing protein
MNSQFRQFLESSPDAMVVIDSGGRIAAANARAASVFGHEPGHLDGRFIEDLFPDQVLNRPPSGSGQAGQDAWRIELVGSRGDSSQFPAEVSIVPLHTRQGPVTAMTIRDITGVQRDRFLVERGLDLLESEGMDRQALIGRLLQMQEDERARIGAEIHDDTIQMISAASLRLQQLRLRLRTPDEVNILDNFEQALRLSLSQLRRLIFNLRPYRLERGLVAAIHTDLEQLRSDTGIDYGLVDNLTTPAPFTAGVLIYRIVREALANVRKHAEAETVQVQLVNVEDGCLVSIVDDGVGYDPAEVENRPGHLGLLLMRERAHLAGGWCRIESAPEAGTTVEFWIPFGGIPTQPETAGEHAA